MIGHKTFGSAQVAATVLAATMIAGGPAVADQVIPDDLIVQGSACVGLDCVNNESFGFDTLRLKENNTRLNFFDTSTLAGFPANKWTITANDSASGGANYLAFDDVTSGRQPFRVTAGAPTASLFVANTGKVGLRTSTPVLDLQITTGDTPAHRLEQTGASGFTAQTWDIGANEANFFVRDVTGGSRLPLRIRPGAPTSSIDVAASGNVGFGTASPGLTGGMSDRVLAIQGSNNPILAITNSTAGKQWGWYVDGTGNLIAFDAASTANRVAISLAGNFGIGTVTPTTQLHTTGGVRFVGVANCGSGIQSAADGTLSCLASSRQFKNVAGDLPSNVALANIMALRPQTGSYKETPATPEHWLIAEEVAAVDPALVGLNEGQPYVVKTQNIVADLIAVVQQQQRQIEELRRLMAAK